MKPFTLLLLIASPFFSFAQDFAGNISLSGHPAGHNNITPIATVKASAAPERATIWQKEEDQVNGSISKAKLSKMKATTALIMTMLRDSCFTPLGTRTLVAGDASTYTPTWHGAYISTSNSGGPLMQFGVDCHFAGQHAELTVTANDLQPLLGHLTVGNQPLLTMDISPAVKNGAQYFEYTDMDGRTTVRRWLITTGVNQLPYQPVSRKEYLLAAKVELASIKSAVVGEVRTKINVRPAAVQEAEEKATIGQLKAMYSGTALEIRLRQYLKNYRTDEQYEKDNADKATAAVDSTMHLVERLLAQLSAAELGKPAIVSVPAIDFNGFEDGHTDKMLVRINPTYYNGGLSAVQPQLFLVEWRFDTSNAAAVDIDRQLTGSFDGQQLKALLTK